MVTQNEVYLQQVRDTANTTLDVLLANINSSIGSGSNTANSALAAVGAAYGQANAAYAQANAARGQANTAYLQANNAYAAANAANAATGVSAGTYGNAGQVPSLVVAANGKIMPGSTSTPYQTFGSAQSGIVPASGGGNINVLFANGVWAAQSSGGSPTIITHV